MTRPHNPTSPLLQAQELTSATRHRIHGPGSSYPRSHWQSITSPVVQGAGVASGKVAEGFSGRQVSGQPAASSDREMIGGSGVHFGSGKSEAEFCTGSSCKPA